VQSLVRTLYNAPIRGLPQATTRAIRTMPSPPETSKTVPTPRCPAIC